MSLNRVQPWQYVLALNAALYQQSFLKMAVIPNVLEKK